jgi:signal transduction histidine kinase
MNRTALQRTSMTTLYVLFAYVVRVALVPVLFGFAPYGLFIFTQVWISFKYGIKYGYLAIVLGFLAGSYFMVHYNHIEPGMFWEYYIANTINYALLSSLFTYLVWQYTKLRSIEQRLNERYHAFVKNSSEGIWRFELDEPIDTKLPADEQVKLMFERAFLAECNESCARMYNVSKPSDMFNTRLSEMLSPEDPANVAYLRQFVESGYRLVAQESHEKDFLKNEKYFLNSFVGDVQNSFLCHAWGSQTDITELKRLEKERQELFEREREARRHAEEVSKIKDEFLANLSHELRTPMNVILGLLRVLLAKSVEGRLTQSELEKSLNVVQRNSEAQLRLINELLETSQIITGKMVIRKEVIHIPDLVSKAIESVRHAVESKNIELVVDADAHCDLVGDSNRIQQIIWNLLINATKFTAPGGRINLSTKITDSTCEIVITDSGKGIDPAFLPHVFERFRQADASMSREITGLGLGLSISKSLAELHGGDLIAKSDGIGKGATFVLKLPLYMNGHETVSFERRIHQRGEQEEPFSISGMRILLIEDHDDSRQFMMEDLSNSGAVVDGVGTTAEAFVLLQAKRYDVILSDLQLPIESGFQFMERVRAAGNQTPAIAVSAYAREEDAQKAKAAGFDRHVAKPVKKPELLAAITALVKKK